MQIGRILGTTRTLGKSQGYLGLPIRDVVLEDGTPAMQSIWELTPTEIDSVVKGGKIRLTVLGIDHLPIMLTVED